MNRDLLIGTLAGKVLAGQRAQRALHSDELAKAAAALCLAARQIGSVELVAASEGGSELIGALKATQMTDGVTNVSGMSGTLVVESVAVTGHNLRTKVHELVDSTSQVAGVWVWQSALSPEDLREICGVDVVVRENQLLST